MSKDIRKLIDDNWDEIKELIIEKVEAEQKPNTIWDLSVGDKADYYRLYSEGDVAKLSFDCYYDEKSREAGNAFLTEEEAKFELERRKIEAILRKHSRPFKKEEQNWYLYYSCNIIDNIINTGVVYEINPGIPLFETKEIAQQVIDKIGKDRLEKYWFGVKE